MKRYIRSSYPRVDDLIGYGVLVQDNMSAQYELWAVDYEHTAKGVYDALKSGDIAKANKLIQKYGAVFENIDTDNIQDDGTVNQYTGYIQLVNPDDVLLLNNTKWRM